MFKKGILISIHALREESDNSNTAPRHCKFISIHALREESDAKSVVVTFAVNVFQSTLSVRRATIKEVVSFEKTKISIHALREESDRLTELATTVFEWISIHALREESDSKIQHNIYS